MIDPVAEMLQIPSHRIYANNLLFNADGSFAGFDEKEPTSRDGGKPAVIQFLKDCHGYKTIAMIGDGATDMQAKPPADTFIGFGGIVVREAVKAGADWFVTDFKVSVTMMCCLNVDDNHPYKYRSNFFLHPSTSRTLRML